MASNQQPGNSNRHSTTTTTTTTTTTSSHRRNGNTSTLTSTRTIPSTVNFGEASRSTTTEPFPALQSEQISRITSNSLQPVASTSSPAFRSTLSSVPGRLRPIGIQRLSSNDLTRQTSRTSLTDNNVSSWSGGRRRSASAPQRPGLQNLGHNEDGTPLQRIGTAGSNLMPVVEDDDTRAPAESSRIEGSRPNRTGSKRMRKASDAAKSAISRMSGSQTDPITQRQNEYESEVVDLLDVLDPEVSALTTLTNVQNSLFVPDLGRFLNRRPTYALSRPPSRIDTSTESKPLPPTPEAPLPPPDNKPLEIPSDIDEEATPIVTRRERRASSASIASHIRQEHFAVLPHGITLEGWTEDEKAMLDDHVRHMLHSRRSKFKRTMRAFGKYVRRPLGFLVTLYAILITLFGLAWVLFLIGWIYVGPRQSYIIDVIDYVLVALFAVVGDGLIPWRIVDTYHMIFIAHYHHLSWRLRKEKALPKLQDHNDLPAQQPNEVDVEAMKYEDIEWSVLSPEQQKKLEHHQNKFCKSHSFYKPHETTTHHAFPLRLLVAIVVLLDCHSMFQVALGATTWGIPSARRPKALTPVILSCSITVNILAGVLIKVGDGRTRKKDVLKRMYRQELTQEAMKKVEKKVEHSRSHEDKQEAEMEREWEEKHAKSQSAEASGSQSGSRSSNSP